MKVNNVIKGDGICNKLLAFGFVLFIITSIFMGFVAVGKTTTPYFDQYELQENTSIGDTLANYNTHMVSIEIPDRMYGEDILNLSEKKRYELGELLRSNLDELSTGDQYPKTDLIVVYTKDEKPILPDYEENQQLSDPNIENNLIFTYNSPEYPWKTSELDFLQIFLNEAYPKAKMIYGEPAFNITVNIRKDPTIYPTGYYNPTTNEMVIKVPEGSDVSFFADVVVHEMIHAFHDDVVIGLASYEEGMARAAEIEVFNQLDNYTHRWDQNHGYTYDVYYEGLNKPEVAWGSGSSLTLLRYQMAGYAWSKAYLEDDEFFVNFNQKYYPEVFENYSIKNNESELKDIARSVKPIVEGDEFDIWYTKQNIFNSDLESGYKLFTRMNQFTIDYFYRYESGSERPQSDALINWSVYDYTGFLLDNGSGITGENGVLSFNREIDIPQGYSGRIKIVASVNSPEGEITDVSFRDFNTSRGAFGVSTTKNDGNISIKAIDSNMPEFKTNVKNGQFSIPDLKNVRGRFSLIYTSGNKTQTSILFTKDASDYFLVVDPNTDPIASFTFTPINPIVNQTINFNTSSSNDLDGNITNFKWNFDDGNTTDTSVTIITHHYTFAGNYTVNLTVTDDDGATNSTKKIVMVSPAENGRIFVPDNYSKIQWAVDNATYGGALIVRDGLYPENVDIYQPMTIQSENGTEYTIVQAEDTNDHVFNITADNVSISGFTVSNANGNEKAGIFISDFASQCNITDITSSNNYIGIYLDSSRNNIFTNITVSNNAEYGFVSNQLSENNTISNLTITDQPTQISFNYGNGIKVKGVDTPPSENISGIKSIGKYINAINETEKSWLFLNISYTESDILDVNESTLSMWKHNGTSWSEVSGSGVNDAENYVYANITEFSIFAPMSIGEIPPAVSGSPEGIDIFISEDIVSTFTEPMNQTLSEEAFFISPSVTGTFSWSSEGDKMTFNPDDNLAYSTEYTITITTDAEDLSGNHLASNYSWKFTTESSPEPFGGGGGSIVPIGGGGGGGSGGGGGFLPTPEIKTDSKGKVLSTYTKESSNGEAKIVLPEGIFAFSADGKPLKDVEIIHLP